LGGGFTVALFAGDFFDGFTMSASDVLPVLAWLIDSDLDRTVFRVRFSNSLRTDDRLELWPSLEDVLTESLELELS
jgi:hypothetical protein